MLKFYFRLCGISIENSYIALISSGARGTTPPAASSPRPHAALPQRVLPTLNSATATTLSMTMNRRDTIILLGALLGSGHTLAQAWPVRPVKVISPFAAGGGSDHIARVLSAKLGPALGQTFVVDNKAGAGGALGTDFVAKAPADGYTLLIAANGPIAVAPLLQAKPAYEPLRDLQPIAQLTRHPYVLVGLATGARDLRKFIETAKSQPGKLNYGTPGAGGAQHLAIEVLKLQAGVDIAHVPYKSGPLALNDLLAGLIDMVSTDINSAMPLIKQGKLRALAVTTAKRSPLLPDVPTVAESGVPGYEVSGWFGVMAPAGTPAPITERLHAEIAKLVATSEVREALAGLGGELLATTPAQFAAHIRSETQRWRELMTKLNIKPDN
jgi:tripartite-type tricarboxylate transporter receptor subunit TctC